MEGANSLSILYFNARSIVPKFDELCAVVEVNNPDIICIVETWLDTSILDSEVALPGYHLHRFDRNRHGGGVLAYVRCHFVVSLHPSPDNLELLTLSVRKVVNKVCISVYYRRPNSLSEVIYFCICSLDSCQFSNYILLGDYNVIFFVMRIILFIPGCTICLVILV